MKKTLIIVITITLISSAISTYYLLSVGFKKQESQGAVTLNYFFENEPSDDFSSDPYISSLYRPGDLLYQPVLDYQNGRLDRAIPKLKDLSEAGNSDAMFWYADHLMKVSVKSRFDGYNWFEKSANLGNPYSALMLDDDNYWCQMYFPSLCNEHWGELATKLLQERAETGDFRAEFYLNKPSSFRTADDFKKMVEAVNKAAQYHYYVPAMILLGRFSRDPNIDDAKKEALAHVYNFMAKYNYIPAYDGLYEQSGLTKTYNIALKLGSKSQIVDLVLRCHKGYEGRPQDEKLKCLSWGYILEEAFNDNYAWAFFPKPSNRQEEMVVTELADEFIKSMTPMIYIDEMHVDGYF
ncbi:hypothetical protein BCT30_23700 [Enterovibrio norvegicus]|uniref:hypothetical protein n=1 Tax=Enterovibrio norvegicus TaxID=188144 RepID=UPI00031CA63E|nr:hypothetical protein [Enterovibrio norvegicus]MCC4799775.1 sel1 repeat family protein [Enterovibrio norvegicus]OEE57169.1 hypothetical protein A1OS_21800 [Enterovibrio norvegicus]PMI25929.1 hypothetical protein BCU47_23545 [Enterovibrio norvegicus]PMI36891.1 hypothetical protein BCU46_12540 [Enterovibrio norvegicus]PMN44631.1 hypothetical protein BCT30_23700 [Enterovibrio norvegicus]